MLNILLVSLLLYLGKSFLIPIAIAVFFDMLLFPVAQKLQNFHLIKGAAALALTPLGSLLWGIAGMFLFVPLFASLKVIFDEIPQLTPYDYLLGKEDEGEVL